MVDLMYVAGEASGDRHAAALHRALSALRQPGEEIGASAIGGSALRAEGVRLIADSSRWGAIGVVESLRGAPQYLAAMERIKRELVRRPPAALILVDFGAFNVRLARWARRSGIGPVIYYLPPGSWKRNPNPSRSFELARLCDLIITPFSWSDKSLRDAGAPSHWVGHPLIDIVKPSYPAAQFAAEFGVDPRRPVIALLPGSRLGEVENILPMMLQAAGIINKRVPGTQFLLAAAPNLDRSYLEGILRDLQKDGASGSRFELIARAGDRLRQIAASAIDAAKPNPAMVTNEGFVLAPGGDENGDGRGDKPWSTVPRPPAAAATLAIVENLTYDCIARADLVITASGTATLETAILNRPMIVVYRGSKLMAFEYHLRKAKLNIRYIALPNIIADELVVPELIGDDASPAAVAEAAVGMLVEPDRLMRLKQTVAERVRPALGEPGVVQRAAELIWNCIRREEAA